MVFLLAIFNNPDTLLNNITIIAFVFNMVMALTSLMLLIKTIHWERLCTQKIMTGEKIVYGRKNFCLKNIYVIEFILLLMVLGYFSISMQNYKVLLHCTIIAVTVTLVYVLTILLKLSREHAYLFYLISYIVIRFVCNDFASFEVSWFNHDEKQVQQIQTEAPLHLSDLNKIETPAESEYITIEKSILASKLSYWYITNGQDMVSLNYEIVDSKYPWVLDLYWKKYTKYHFEELSNKEANAWNAVAVAKNSDSNPNYMIMYQNHLIFLNYEDELTPHRVQIIKEKLVDEVSNER